MNRRSFLTQAAAALATGSQARAAKRPNVVFILADDLGWADLSCYGSTFYESPNLDRFAASGMRFTDAYSACPVCSPTRAAIMTGKYPARIGLTDYLPGLQPKDQRLLSVEDIDGLPLSEVTMAEALEESGYRTFIAGKWHLGVGDQIPLKQGFDENHDKETLGFSRGYHRKTADGKEDYQPDRLTDKAIDFLDRARNDPFFLYLPYHLVHTPIEASERHVDRFRKKLKGIQFPPGPRLAKERRGTTRLYQDGAEYASMVYALDENVGRLLAKLDDLELAGNTVVLFTSDNGGLCTLRSPEGGPTSNRPLRSGKGWCYEGGIRVPLLARAPGVTRAGSTSSVPIISTDYYPTVLDLLGLPSKPQQHLDGKSLVSVMRGQPKLQRDAIYWHYPHYHGSAWAPGAAVRAGDWKLIEFYEEEKAELYNLKNDLGEKNDLAAKMPEQTNRLRDQLRGWQSKVGAKMPQKNPAFSG